jgi:hypothetical protein
VSLEILEILWRLWISLEILKILRCLWVSLGVFGLLVCLGYLCFVDLAFFTGVLDLKDLPIFKVLQARLVTSRLDGYSQGRTL